MNLIVIQFRFRSLLHAASSYENSLWQSFKLFLCQIKRLIEMACFWRPLKTEIIAKENFLFNNKGFLPIHAPFHQLLEVNKV